MSATTPSSHPPSHVDHYLAIGQQAGASDVHLGVNAPPIWRLHGVLQPIWPDAPKLTSQQTLDLAERFLSDVQKNQLNERGNADFAYSNPLGRYRTSVVRQRLGVDLVFRIINTKVRTMDELGLPESFVGRHPFPGPGLAIRVPGEITGEKLDILRKADTIYLDEIRKAGLYDKIWQAFAVLLPVRTVGVMGDARTYDAVCALRAVTSSDGMTADYYPFEHSFLAKVSTRIVNEVRGINRVVYDITSKPPGTIEWE